MPAPDPDQETPEHPTFVVGFADTAEGRYGIEQAAADQLPINLRIESWTTSPPPSRSPEPAATPPQDTPWPSTPG